jgi:UDP-N-acetylglucosamine transferase subunit ALG13
MTSDIKTIFITVGTTLFEPLIECATNPLFLNNIALHGYNRLVIQYGKGRMPEIMSHDNNGMNHEENEKLGVPVGVPVVEGQKQGVYRYRLLQQELQEIKSSSPCASTCTTIKIHWEIYKFKPSLEEDMNNADLIISHAGAGSIMEGLEHCRRRNSGQNENMQTDKDHRIQVEQQSSSKEKKKLVVVINDQLMDNHQCELAYALKKRDYLYVISEPDMLLKREAIEHIIEKFQPKCFEGGNESSFGQLADDFMGYTTKTS